MYLWDCASSCGTCRNADALDLPIKLDAGACFHAAADCFAKLFDLRGRCPAFVDQEIAVKLGDLGRADGKAAQARLVDQLPGLVARRILEG